MSWGNKLMIVFIGFAMLILTLVYKSMHTKFELVSKDYYKDEIHYQDQIDGMNNAKSISAIHITQDADSLAIHFPNELEGFTLDGEAWFYKNTDAQKDRRLNFSTSKGEQLFSKLIFFKGEYKLKLTWKSKDKNYYAEQMLMIN